MEENTPKAQRNAIKEAQENEVPSRVGLTISAWRGYLVEQGLITEADVAKLDSLHVKLFTAGVFAERARRERLGDA